MKTDSKILASFLAASAWADEEFDEFEQDFLNDLAQELDIPTLQKEVEDAFSHVEKLEDEALTDYLMEKAAYVAENEKEGILMLCLQLMCADALLSVVEVENYFVLAEILGVKEDAASTILDEFVEEEEDLIIEEE